MSFDFEIKQGRSFKASGFALNDDDTPRDISNIALHSHVRDKRGRRVAILDVAVIDAISGEYELSANDTTSWPPGTLYLDILELENGEKTLTETIVFKVEEAITRL
ncbi:hypothetical protein [Methylocucumis oryzae]|uniref:BppU N-terminal domain-containing protein n=1 Tax=Methylocucumis oryzae TaxID=1632867 RepID=A0A0F3IMY9_9GAMM|nr:hypothetical protein [Methylocucumis oryzae]KJV08071.1 hypothetical protein VZ94_00490 [Methylocucumis oryzae]